MISAVLYFTSLVGLIVFFSLMFFLDPSDEKARAMLAPAMVVIVAAAFGWLTR